MSMHGSVDTQIHGSSPLIEPSTGTVIGTHQDATEAAEIPGEAKGLATIAIGLLVFTILVPVFVLFAAYQAA